MQNRCGRCNTEIDDSELLCEYCKLVPLPDSVIKFNKNFVCSVCGWYKDTPAHELGCPAGRKEVTFD